MAGERRGRCGLPSSRDYVDGEAFCFHGTGRDSDKLACRDRELSRLRARLALAEAVIERTRKVRSWYGSPASFTAATSPTDAFGNDMVALDAALQAFDRAANPETERGTPERPTDIVEGIQRKDLGRD